MKLLSIDLDYIMGPCIEIYQGLFIHPNAGLRWSELYNNSDFTPNTFKIDESNLMFCFNTFLKALKNNPTVTFGYDHDSILYDAKDFKDIELINIDHHDDVFHGMGDAEYEYDLVTKHNVINEGNWGIWLQSVGRLKSFTWIGNKNSGNKDRNEINYEYLNGNYINVEKENYTFEDYNFDHIFVCLSPQYIPPQYWHYFAMFINTYEHFTGKDAKIITGKFEADVRHLSINNEILH